MRTLGKALTAVAFAAIGLIGSADSGTWVNETDSATLWRTAANWKAQDGGTVAAAPTTTSDTAAFGVQPKTWLQKIGWAVDDPGNWTRVEYGLASLSDEGPYSRRCITVNTSNFTDYWEVGAWLTLLDPNGFHGFLSAAAGNFGVRLPATAAKPLVLASVSAAHRTDIEVPTAGTKATVGTVYEGGSLVKTGAGELEVDATTGDSTVIHVSAGKLTLAGRGASDPGDDVPVAGAWMHLDANRTDTMESQEDPSDHRQYVSRWNDVRGEGHPYAYFNSSWSRGSATYLSEFSHAPFLNDSCFADRTVMDFGRSAASQSADLGPIGCWMQFSKSSSAIREVFVVSSSRSQMTSVIGNKTDGILHFHRNGRLPAHDSYGPQLAYGEIMKDGVRVDNTSGVWMDDFTVVSIGATNVVTAEALATDRMYGDGRVGGCRIAEVILFTNELTRAERLLVHRYLQRKWTAPDAANDHLSDVGTVTLASNDTVISVPAGRSAYVPEVTAVGGTLVKEGEGELVVGALSSVSRDGRAEVEVRGGSVRFGGLKAVSSDEPAAGAWLWLDCDRSYMTTESRDGKDYVTQWRDRRPSQTDFYAETPSGEADYVAGAMPYVVDEAENGLGMVDFGPVGKKTASSAYLRIHGGSGRTTYDAYIVYVATQAAGLPVFGNGYGCELYPGGNHQFLVSSYGSYKARNAIWTYNGAVVDPVAAGQAEIRAGECNVVGFSAQEKLVVKTLGSKDRTVGDGGMEWGGCRIGEVLLYDRRLTPAERRQTIAYLMKRWRGMDIAVTGAGDVPRITFRNGAEPVIDTDADISVDEVKTDGDSLVKRGTGELAIRGMLGEQGISDLTVAGGTVVAAATPINAILAKTTIHFDATDSSKFLDYFVTVDGDCNPQTNLVSIGDCRGTTKLNAFIDSRYAFTNPVVRTVATAEGVMRPVFDFGWYNLQGMEAYSSKNTGGFLMSPVCTTIREAHTIFADTKLCTGVDYFGMDIFAANDYSLDYFRNGGKTILTANASYSAKARAGRMGVDGVIMTGGEASAYDMPRGFHLVSAFPNGATEIGAMALTHGCGAGGCQIGELIGFSEALPETESTFLQGWLMAKWLGRESPTWVTELDSLSLADGAGLDIGVGSLKVASLSGSGSVAARSVSVSSSLEIPFGSPLAVDGTFVQNGNLAVSVTGIPDRCPEGLYELLSATAFEGLDLAAWHLVSAVPHGRTASFVLRNGCVCLEVSKNGSLILVR